ncbi:hypothetical protein IWW36_003246 [Coemansia brasiliensis]|uniref:GATA-type domain-containing protein n=1 Tax=Coemansia brasiliensis TaxID=2650707 RepID=A0A9W8M089_9FUNG|nr:hypothetical protein IWW36_003246 [Coemansia brasiliensis]
MTAIEKKRSADAVTEVSSIATDSPHTQRISHPCFWAVLDGEGLNFVFISASLDTFLGSERTPATVLGQSLFDYIHPEEAHHARRDLANLFITKSFVGSNIRASESQIPPHRRASQQLQESLERKLSLPTIPDIVKLRANDSRPLSPTAPSSVHQPMPKRLRTILEDSVGSFVPGCDSRFGQQPGGPNNSNSKSTNGGGSGNSNSSDNSGSSEYLIANIGLYLVSERLLVMVCHYEDLPFKERLLVPELHRFSLDKAGKQTQPQTQSPAAQCDCTISTPTADDSKRIQLLMSQIYRLDSTSCIGHQQMLIGAATRTSALHGAGGGDVANKDGNGGGGRGGRHGSLTSRHMQIYSVNTEQLLCVIPEDAYRRIHGKTLAEATKGGAGLRGLWQHCNNTKSEAHAMSLLQGPSIPNADPIRVDLQVRSGSSETLADVQCLLFRWGHLLFVCQQMRGGYTPEMGTIGALGEDSILSTYNLSAPSSNDPLRSGKVQDAAAQPAQLEQCNSTGAANHDNSTRVPLRSSVSQNHGSSDPRPFSLPRAPASIAANLPVRTLPPAPAPVSAEAVPPRRQSSYTLPPAKSFEERRFSYPIQTLYTERRPPPLPIPHGQQSQQQHPHPIHPPAAAAAPPSSMQYTGVSSANATPGSGISRGSPATASPSGRLIDTRQRMALSARSSGSLLGKGSGEASTQPTPSISPMSAGIVQHTPTSLSPVPQSQLQPHSANPANVHVNIYPPETSVWRWSHGQQTLPAQSQTLPPTPNSNGTSYPQHSYTQRPPPPLALNRAMNSLHPHFLHGMHDQYQSPVGSAVASPGVVGPPSAHRTDPEKKTCKSCGTDSSPEWRKGPTGHKT